MHLKIFTLLLTVISFSAFSQESRQTILKEFITGDIQKLGINHLDSSENSRTYRLWVTYQQVIELKQINDSTCKGFMLNYINQSTGSGKRQKENVITQKITIPENLTCRLIEQLRKENIENLPDQNEIDGHPNGLDGIAYIFEIKTDLNYRIYSYWEPQNDRYWDSNIPEIQNVRTILETLKVSLKPRDTFGKLIDRLPPGNYSYGGIQMIKSR